MRVRVKTLAYLVLISIIAAALAYLALYFLVPRESPGMGRGMGPQLYVWVPIVIAPLTFVAGLLAYVTLFPEIEQKLQSESALPREQRSLEAVLRVLKDDEKKVVEILMNAQGTMLQSDIARKTGFSRVKTHRILHRLATRGIVTAKKTLQHIPDKPS